MVNAKSEGQIKKYFVVYIDEIPKTTKPVAVNFLRGDRYWLWFLYRRLR
jgi:hypothetical protein